MEAFVVVLIAAAVLGVGGVAVLLLRPGTRLTDPTATETDTSTRER